MVAKKRIRLIAAATGCPKRGSIGKERAKDVHDDQKCLVCFLLLEDRM